MSDETKPTRKPGECVPWEEFRKTMPEIRGDEQIVKRVHEDIDALANMYIWHCLLSF